MSVMLEKLAGMSLVTKFRAILPMKADFNCHNMLTFGDHMMKLKRDNGLLPKEI